MSSRASMVSSAAVSAAALLAAFAAPLAAHAQVVVRDAETGQLRAPTAEEAAALNAAPAAPAARAAGIQRNQARVQAAPAEVTLPDGTVMLETDDSTLMYSVVRRNADGSMSRYCVQGKAQAAQVLKAKAPQSFAKPITAAKSTQGVAYELK